MDETPKRQQTDFHLQRSTPLKKKKITKNKKGFFNFFEAATPILLWIQAGLAHGSTLSHCETSGHKKRRRIKQGREREDRDSGEIKRRLMSSVWICRCPGVAVFQRSGMWPACFVSLIPLQQPPGPTRAALARAHYHPMTQSVCQDDPHHEPDPYPSLTPPPFWPCSRSINPPSAPSVSGANSCVSKKPLWIKRGGFELISRWGWETGIITMRRTVVIIS